MTKQNYYCLIAGLPEIIADEKKHPFSSIQFREMLHEELTAPDFELVKLYYLPFDHKNLLTLLFKKETNNWDTRGNYSHEELETTADRKQFELAENTVLTPYMHQFMEQFYSSENIGNTFYEAERILTSGYYSYLSKNRNRFVRETALHSQITANVTTALSCRKLGTDCESALVGNDEITHSIAKSRAHDFGLAVEIPDIEMLAQIYETENIVEREFKLDLYKWQYLDEITFFDYFSIEKILAYIAKLFIAERWYGLNKAKGHDMFNRILTELRAGFQLPDQFTTVYGTKK